MSQLRIGIIGLDTSHVIAFTRLLNDASQPHYVAGAKVVAAYPGGSPDFARSRDRVEGYTQQLKEEYGLKICQQISELRDLCDAILLESVDGRVHLAQFKEVVEWGMPVFIDKPLTVSSEEASALQKIAEKHGARVMSSSALRFSEPLVAALKDISSDKLTGADVYGPMEMEPTQPGYFWYGIHSVEMLFAVMGSGCDEVFVTKSEDHDVITGKWSDGRIGSVRGNRVKNSSFGGVLHSPEKSVFYDVSSSDKPFYACLLEQVMKFFTGQDIVRLENTVEIIRFIEAANQSAETGKVVSLS